jgi:hypothetical protein
MTIETHCPRLTPQFYHLFFPFDLYTDVSTNQMHHAWQAGLPAMP